VTAARTAAPLSILRDDQPGRRQVALTRLCPFCLEPLRECACPDSEEAPVIPGMREIPDPQAEVERLAAMRAPYRVTPEARAELARRFKFTDRQIDALTAENVALLLAEDDSKRSQ
jgi:hypothetical protein